MLEDDLKKKSIKKNLKKWIGITCETHNPDKKKRDNPIESKSKQITKSNS